MKNADTEALGATKQDVSSPASVVPGQYLYPFVIVTTLFALWGFANDITNPLVRAFKEIFLISNAQSSLVQWAFYGGYATMAIPAALVIRKVSYKSGIIIGLLLYAIGALLTIPASIMMEFNIFLIGFYVLTFGLAFLETTANPYILSMGPTRNGDTAIESRSSIQSDRLADRHGGRQHVHPAEPAGRRVPEAEQGGTPGIRHHAAE